MAGFQFFGMKEKSILQVVKANAGKAINNNDELCPAEYFFSVDMHGETKAAKIAF